MDGKITDRYTSGLYSSRELAQRAADKFLSLAEKDTEWIGRSTILQEHELDRGWHEEHWA